MPKARSFPRRYSRVFSADVARMWPELFSGAPMTVDALVDYAGSTHPDFAYRLMRAAGISQPLVPPNVPSKLDRRRVDWFLSSLATHGVPLPTHDGSLGPTVATAGDRVFYLVSPPPVALYPHDRPIVAEPDPTPPTVEKVPLPAAAA